MTRPTCVHPTLEELFPVFRTCFSRATSRQLLSQTAPTTTFYWRLFAPLIVLCCLIVQRLNKELVAGVLTYNLICAMLVQAAVQAELAPNRLSFQRGLRRK